MENMFNYVFLKRTKIICSNNILIKREIVITVTFFKKCLSKLVSRSIFEKINGRDKIVTQKLTTGFPPHMVCFYNVLIKREIVTSVTFFQKMSIPVGFLLSLRKKINDRDKIVTQKLTPGFFSLI